MGRFLEAEKKRQTAFKERSLHFSDLARGEGMYKGRLRPFCLPRELAPENLFREIRADALAYFARQRIKWHDGEGDRPSNHLCDSQVSCVNFLFPFAHRPQALAELLSPAFPFIRQMLPLEEEFPDLFVSFEWIGKQNYLGEKTRGSERTRGANCTSADAAVMFEREDGKRQIVLVEWKYTESYSDESLRFAPSGRDRASIYEPLYEKQDCLLDKALLKDFADLFYEPFYQLMRLQFLAHEMERAPELGAAVVSLLHIAPAHNTDFTNVTSPALRLRYPGRSAIDVWGRLVRVPDRFAGRRTEELFGSFPIERLPELAPWWEYVSERYPWFRAHDDGQAR
jgi:hypothetical protein